MTLLFHLEAFSAKSGGEELLKNYEPFHSFKEGLYRPAERELKYIRERDIRGWLLLGWINASKQNTKDAISNTTAVIKTFIQYPTSPNESNREFMALWEASAYALRAELYLQKKKYELALKDAEAAIKADPSYEPAYVIRAQLHLNAKNWQDAINDSHHAIQLNKKYEPAHIILAQAALRNNNYDLAIQTAKGAIKLNANNVMAHAILSDAYAKQGDVASSLEAAKNALKIMNAKNLSEKDKDFSKLHSSDIQQLKAKCKFEKALMDLETHSNKLLTELQAKKSTTPNDTLLEEKVTALKQLRKTLEGPIKNIMQTGNKSLLLKALHAQDLALNKHRGYGKTIKNVLLAAGLLGVGYVFAGLIHLAATGGKQFTFFNDTTTMKKIKNIEKQAHLLTKARKR